MGFLLQKSRPALAGLLAALAVEFADELVDGTKSAAIPLIKHDLVLTYFEVGLLTAVPLLLGSLIELPFGVMSGTGRRRRRFVLTGGLVFIGSVLAAGLAGSFPVLLAALVIFFPASGAFVSLTQSALMDAYPDRRTQHMARWTLAWRRRLGGRTAARRGGGRRRRQLAAGVHPGRSGRGGELARHRGNRTRPGCRGRG